MYNLTLQLNAHFDSTHAGNHHRFRMISRLQTPSNLQHPSIGYLCRWYAANAVEKVVLWASYAQNVKNRPFWWLKFYTYFTYIGNWQQPTTIPLYANMGAVYVLRDTVVLMFLNAHLFKKLWNLMPKLRCRRPHRSAPMTWSFSPARLHTH